MSKFNLSLAAENQRTPVVGTGYRNQSYVSDEVEQMCFVKERGGGNSVTKTPGQTCSSPVSVYSTICYDRKCLERDNKNGDYRIPKANEENHTRIDMNLETKELGLPAEAPTTADINKTYRSGDTTQDDDREVPDGGWGYIVAVGCFVSMINITAMGSCFGILFSQFLKDLGTSSTTTAWIFNSGGFACNLATFLSGPALKQFGYRKVAVVGAVLSTVGMGISAFATSSWFLFLSYSLLTNFGCGMSILVLFAILPLYFKQRLGRANAFVNVGACISQIMWPPTITFLQEKYGIKGASLIVSAVMLNNVAAAAIFHPVEWHVEARGRSKKRLASGKESVSASFECGFAASLVKGAISVARNFTVLRSPRAVIIAIGSCFNIFGYLNMLMLVPEVVADKGYTQEQASWCMSISGFCNLVTRILVSSLTDWPWFSMRGCFMVGTATVALTTIALNHVDEIWSVALVMGVWGVGVGAFISLLNLIMIKYLGLENLVPVYGVTFLMVGVWSLASGPLLGVIQDLSGSYAAPLYMLGGTVFLTLVLWCFMPAAVAYDKRREHQQQQEQQTQEAAGSPQQASAEAELPGQAVTPI